jgi:hypothetical protein
MPQIFHPSTNTISKASIFGAVFIIAAFAGVLLTIFRSPYTTRVNVPIEQPVPFSHRQHVGSLGIDCRYCHMSVEVSRYADIPPTHTCMTCHSQIWVESPVLEPVRASWRTGQSIPWNKVHDVGDFAYFDHSIHVNKGVGCETCHGRADDMPLMMKAQSLQMDWCLDCHRTPEKYLRPLEEVFTLGYVPPENQLSLGLRLKAEYQIAPRFQLEDCSVCHR